MIEKWKPILIYCKIISLYSLPKSIELLGKFVGFFKASTKSWFVLKIFWFRFQLMQKEASVSAQQLSQLCAALGNFQAEWKMHFQLVLLLLHC